MMAPTIIPSVGKPNPQSAYGEWQPIDDKENNNKNNGPLCMNIYTTGTKIYKRGPTVTRETGYTTNTNLGLGVISIKSTKWGNKHCTSTSLYRIQNTGSEYKKEMCKQSDVKFPPPSRVRTPEWAKSANLVLESTSEEKMQKYSMSMKTHGTK